jgi:integrase
VGIFKRHHHWWIDYTKDGLRKRRKIGKDKKQAQKILDKIRYETTENKFQTTLPEIPRIKFADFCDEYLELHSKINNRAWRGFDLNNIKVFKKHFPGKYLDDITPFIVEEFKAKRIQEVSPATVNRNLATLKAIYNKAIFWGRYSGINPVKRVKFFRENNKRLRFLEKSEIVTLLDNCVDYLKPIVIIAINTGMRKREILDLKWTDIDFQRRIIFLHNTKNGETREVPMNQNAINALLSVDKHKNSAFIFINGKNGKTYYNIRKCFLTALEKSAIKDFRFHDLRHTCASHLVMNGIDLNTVRELLGHKSLEMTLRYSHLSQNHKRKAVEILGQNVTKMTPSDQEEDAVSETIDAQVIEVNKVR